MSVSVVIVRKGDLPVFAAFHVVFADHGRAILVTAVVNDGLAVITPHFVAYPVFSVSCIAAWIA